MSGFPLSSWAWVVGAVLLGGVLGVLTVSSTFTYRETFVSSETKFTDLSRGGLAIVPASCPSSPDFAGQCTPPTCTITLISSTVIGTQASTLSWSSSDATSMSISGIGSVALSGSTSVAPGVTTTYTGSVSGPGGTGTCAGTLTVNLPSPPTASITADSSTVQIGASTVIRASFAAGTYDSLTSDNIDSPEGTGLGATTNPDPNKTYTFAPTTPGTYTFYARMQTAYYPTWATYASVSVTVPPVPACSVNFSANPIARGQSSTVSWTSSNASTFSLNTLGAKTPNVSDSQSVSPSSSTSYGGTAVGSGGSASCPATLTVTCTPAYSCSGDTIQYTDATCSTSNVTTCVAPTFCSVGAAACLYPPPTFNPSSGSEGDYTGHLQVRPQLVQQGTATKVYWNISYMDASSCNVHGSNGDDWSGLATSGASGKTTSAINQQTTYTLTCTGLDGSLISESVSVGIAPAFQEI